MCQNVFIFDQTAVEICEITRSRLCPFRDVIIDISKSDASACKELFVGDEYQTTTRLRKRPIPESLPKRSARLKHDNIQREYRGSQDAVSESDFDDSRDS